MFWGVWIPGLFHTKIADTHGTLLTHMGKPNTGLRSQDGQGDMVLENAILFMRDALISREFTDAVKAGDSERVVLVSEDLGFELSCNGSHD
jgi:hypothetical protein